MSNNNVPGSNQNVNVQVRTLINDPNVTSQYKTKILHKNVVNGVNTLTQEMMSAQNTKYVVKYDYVLGENITVPENCILEFDGGSIGSSVNNDTITGTNTKITCNYKFYNILFGGTFINTELVISAEHFTNPSISTILSSFINANITLLMDVSASGVDIETSRFCIDGRGHTFTAKSVWLRNNSGVIDINNVVFDMTNSGRTTDNQDGTNFIYSINASQVNINNCKFINVTNSAIHIRQSENATISNCKFIGTYTPGTTIRYGVGLQLQGISKTLLVENNEFYNITSNAISCIGGRTDKDCIYTFKDNIIDTCLAGGIIITGGTVANLNIISNRVLNTNNENTIATSDVTSEAINTHGFYTYNFLDNYINGTYAVVDIDGLDRDNSNCSRGLSLNFKNNTIIGKETSIVNTTKFIVENNSFNTTDINRFTGYDGIISYNTFDGNGILIDDAAGKSSSNKMTIKYNTLIMSNTVAWLNIANSSTPISGFSVVTYIKGNSVRTPILNSNLGYIYNAQTDKVIVEDEYEEIRIQFKANETKSYFIKSGLNFDNTPNDLAEVYFMVFDDYFLPAGISIKNPDETIDVWSPDNTNSIGPNSYRTYRNIKVSHAAFVDNHVLYVTADASRHADVIATFRYRNKNNLLHR